MERVSAFVPGHITGFFQIHDDSEDPSVTGSRNCGPCIDAGVLTEVEIVERSNSKLEVFINGKKRTAKTTETAVEGALESGGRSAFVRVKHSVESPIGSGYGMSGAGALGAVLALSEALNLGLDRSEVLTEAHRAEVVCGTGLGDVGPQMLGGVVVGLEPGSPPRGKWERMEVDKGLKVVCGTEGPLSTSEFLDNLDLRKRSREMGAGAMRNLLSDLSMKNFMDVSRKFALDLDVLDEEFVNILEEISSNTPLGASAVMLGRAIFAPGMPSKVDDLEQIFLEYFRPEEVMVTSVDFEGTRLLR